MRAHSRRSSADPRNPGAQTRPGFIPQPPPTSPAGRLPCQVQNHAPNKSQLIRTLPLNRSPPLGCDQISAGEERENPLLFPQTPAAPLLPAEELPAGLQPLPPPLNHSRITGR